MKCFVLFIFFFVPYKLEAYRQWGNNYVDEDQYDDQEHHENQDHHKNQFHNVNLRPKNTNEYYWMDFYGKAVKDAFIINNNNIETQYIGLTYYPIEGVLLPSTLKNFDHFAQSVYAEKTLNSSLYTKILCNPNSALKWIPVHKSSIKQVQIDCALVPGGYANSQKLFIGRDDKFNIGPVYPNNKNNSGLFTYNGSEIIHNSNKFYVLGRCLDINHNK